MNLKNKLALIALLLFNIAVFAQNKTVTGQVVSATDNIPIPGVNVIVLNTTRGTTTDFDGGFKIDVKNGEVLQFSYIGFVTQTQAIKDQKTINISLQEDIAKLDEVVVVGYGTQKRSSVTGSVAKLKSENIENAPVSRLDQAIQGKIAGVRVQNISSEAGSDTQINIRGVSSVNAGSGPLIVVDGQPVPDGMGAINNADVESVEVLKDAASAAIYGSRGAGGVILITTKKGKEGKTRFSFNSMMGVKEAYETYDIMSSLAYVERLYAESALRIADPLWTGSKTQAGTIPSLDKWRSQYAIEKELLGGIGTDYQDEVLRTAFYQDLQFNVSGGSKKNKYYASLGYQDDQGLMLNSSYQKLNFRFKFDSELTDKIKLNINLNPSNTQTERPGTNYIDFTRFPSFLPVYHTQATADFINAANPNANIVVGSYAEDDDFANLAYTSVDPDGVPFTTGTSQRAFTTSNTNPMRALLEQYDNNNQFRFQGSVSLNFEIAKGLDFKTTQNLYFRNSEREETGQSDATRVGNPNYATYTSTNYFDFLTENTFNYNKSIGDHDFTALAGFTYEKTNTKSLQTRGTTFPTDDIKNLNFATVILAPVQSDITVGLMSFLGRVNYAYKSKYLLTASYRTDGSTLFDVGNKWGGFPAVSIGWVVSKENFFSEIESINRLAFRASYGATGNNAIPPFLYQETLNPSNYVTGPGTGSITTGLANLSNVYSNPLITWERTFQTNLGFDLAMFRNKINLNIDVFESRTEKLLLENSALLITGSSSVITNAGSLKNRGFEVELSTVNARTEAFTWSTDFNISRFKNKITDLGDKDRLISPTIDNRNGLNNYAIVGETLISFFGYKTDGVWNSNADIAASGLTTTLTNGIVEGGIKIVDVDGNGIINTDDRVILGDPYPDFTWGITNKLNYKNIDLNFTFQGVLGGELINGDINYNEAKERNLNYMRNRWVSPSNPGDGKTPYVTNGFNWLFTDNAVEDATYFSLREASLGYSLGKDALESIKLTNLRFSLTGQNLLFVTKDYRGINIEARTSQTSPLIDGYQRGGFPIQKTILFGIEVGF
ncbi:SusC/RagA family TonB-linked outer membrane protein [Mariniflexile sp.]|uniref:SusC/RagA family TonB-linked outer membrane protein n=1 Tax=Mariniflexile sp. TaxID=1979402 RepID=UPI004048C00B